MKTFTLFAIAITCCICFSITSTISSCSKTINHYDTTTITLHDTTTVHDTTACTYDLKDGLVAYYTFNNGSLSDSSGYNNNITFSNATKTTDRFGNPDNAYLFDGSSSYMVVKNNSSINPDNITLYTIVKVNGFYTGTCGGNEIISKGYPYDIDGFYHLYFADFLTGCSINTPPVQTHELFSGGYGDNIPQGAQSGVNDTTSIIPGQWYYIVYTYDGQTSKLYINGELKSSLQKTATFTANTQDLFIGKHENPLYPYYFNGVIDEIRIYNKALTPDAINHLINFKD